MRRLTIFMLISVVLFLWEISSANYNPQLTNSFPVIADSGVHPDSFGYTWVDNDNGGSPIYNWVDITNRGIQVQGLQDDNAVGPFQLGFDFPYYWYTVDHMWIGANGYISFSASWPFAYPFGRIPGDSIPTDLVAPLAGDLDLTVGDGTCYYWSNAGY